MPQPHLLPSAADLLRLADIMLVAALTAGMGFLAGARRLETAFFSGWGLASLVLVAVGTWSPVDLGTVAAGAGLLGGIGLLRQLAQRTSRPIGGDRLGLRVLLLGTPFILLILGMADIAWDDFSFWVPNLLHLCATGHFPTLAQPAAYSAMAAYPYGVALSGFAVHLLGGTQLDTVAFVWNLLAMLAACAAFANIIARRVRAAGETLTKGALWSVASCAVLVVGMGNPAFVAKNLLTNMGDSATSAGLALLCALLFEWTATPPGASDRTRILIEISLTCCAVVFIRQANPALLALVFLSAMGGLLLFQDRIRLPALAGLFSTLLLPVFVWYSWMRYADAEIPHGRHYLLPWQEWHWSVFGSTLAAALHVLIVKTGYTAMAVGMGGIAVYYIVRRMRSGGMRPTGRGEAASAVVATVAAGLTFGNIAFLLFCYLGTSFGIDEARQAITFWRFIGQTSQALLIGFACVMPVAWLVPWLRRVPLQRLLPAVALAVPIVAVSTYRDDLSSPVPGLRAIADDLHQTVPADQPIALLDLSGNGFAPLLVKYEMTAIDDDRRPLSVIADPHGISPDRARALPLPSATYVWVAEGSSAYGKMFGITMSSGCSYLFRNSDAGYLLTKRWSIGRYRWEIQKYADEPAIDRGCRG